MKRVKDITLYVRKILGHLSRNIAYLAMKVPHLSSKLSGVGEADPDGEVEAESFAGVRRDDGGGGDGGSPADTM